VDLLNPTVESVVTASGVAERRGDSHPGQGIESEFVVSASKVLHYQGAGW